MSAKTWGSTSSKIELLCNICYNEVANFRGTLSEYQNHPKVKKIINKVLDADYIIAPIADNKMFETIDDFINGNITNVQCEHCLSATNLGKQYVFKSDKAIKQLTLLHRCYLAASEKEWYVNERQKSYNESLDKIKMAMRTYIGSEELRNLYYPYHSLDSLAAIERIMESKKIPVSTEEKQHRQMQIMRAIYSLYFKDGAVRAPHVLLV